MAIAKYHSLRDYTLHMSLNRYEKKDPYTDTQFEMYLSLIADSYG